MSDVDDEIRRLISETNALKRGRMDQLPRCSFCAGSGSTGVPTYMTLCSVCRGTKVDQGELYKLRQKWGEL